MDRCSRCAMVYYCGRECQRVGWPRHRPVCGKTLDGDAPHVKAGFSKRDGRAWMDAAARKAATALKDAGLPAEAEDWSAAVGEAPVRDLEARPLADPVAKVVVRKHAAGAPRVVGVGAVVPVGRAGDVTVHRQQGVLELELEGAVPDHEDRREVGRVAFRVQRRDDVLRHEGVVGPERRAVARLALGLAQALHCPHGVDDVAPLGRRQAPHLAPHAAPGHG